MSGYHGLFVLIATAVGNGQNNRLVPPLERPQGKQPLQNVVRSENIHIMFDTTITSVLAQNHICTLNYNHLH